MKFKSWAKIKARIRCFGDLRLTSISQNFLKNEADYFKSVYKSLIVLDLAL
jgi:hypothetical protein